MIPCFHCNQHLNWDSSTPKRCCGISILVRLWMEAKGICYLCDRPVDFPTNKPSTSSMRPSRDHIVPRHEGGKSEYKNLALAHQVCNEMRHNALNKNGWRTISINSNCKILIKHGYEGDVLPLVERLILWQN